MGSYHTPIWRLVHGLGYCTSFKRVLASLELSHHNIFLTLFPFFSSLLRFGPGTQLEAKKRGSREFREDDRRCVFASQSILFFLSG